MAGGVDRVLAKSHEIRSPLLAKPIGRTAALKKKKRFGAFQRMGSKNLRFRARLQSRVSTP